MRKKLLAGILALALCSANMIPQTIFAEEFTSGNSDVVSEEETPEVFTNEELEAAGETGEELSVFSEGTSEFEDNNNESNKLNEAPQIVDVNLSDSITDNVYTIDSGDKAYRFTSKGETFNRIVVDGTSISEQASINIYLDNVNIATSAGPALQIKENVKATVTIFLKGTNNLIATNRQSAGLQKNNSAELIITNAQGTTEGTLMAESKHGDGAGIGGGVGGSGRNITIEGGSVTAISFHGAGIGGGVGGSGSNIIINDGSVTASSFDGAGIGGGDKGSGENITITRGSVYASSFDGAGIGGGVGGSGSNIIINDGSVTAISFNGAGIGGGSGGSGSDITIKGGSVTASSTYGDGIGSGEGGSCEDITINGGSVNAYLSKRPKNTSGAEVYLCTINNPNSSDVKVDGSPWTPVNHKNVNPDSTNLYAWLTGKDHLITFETDTVETDKKGYVFDSKKGRFSSESKDKHEITSEITSKIFEFADSNKKFTYDGNPKTPQITLKDTNKGVGNIKVKYFKGGEPITEPKDVGTYTIEISVEEGDFYKATTSDLTNENWKFEITRGNLNPKITESTGMYNGSPYPVIKIEKDTIPENSKIEYSVDNKQTWKTLDSSNPIPTVRTVKEAENTKIYIRISNTNYNEWISKEYKAIIRPATSTPGFPSDTEISVPWSCKKVEDVKDCLGNNWKWRDSDISKELPVGKEISATAVYNGTDAGNYLNESVEFKITRKECEHKNTVGRYYSSPSCTSSGYSGDTYCNDCKRTIYYGSTIPAYGHDYDNGVITTEPTTETDGIITYTCKRCKHQDTKNLGKLGDGEPYIEGSFQKKGWDAVNDLIKASKEKNTISITLNGTRTLPASVLSGIKGKDISLNLDMENGFIWKINGTSITSETPADIDLSVTNTAEYIPAALYSLISTNQNDFGFHLGRSGAFDFPAVLSVKADASCAGLMANLFWYDVENGVLQCIQTVTVGGAFERSIPYADSTLSKGQDYFIAFGTESLNGRVIHTDGSITDENGAYLRPANTKISSYSIDRNKLTVRLSKGCAGAQGYDFVISKKSDMLKTGKFSKTVSSSGKPQASFRYLSKGTWYVAARSWVLDAQGNKVYGSWTKIKKIKITVVTPQQPKIRNITVEGNTVTVTYTKCKNATGYEILLGTKYKTSAGEKYPVKKYVKRTEGKNTVTVTFKNVKKGTWYVTVRSWNRTSKNKSRVYSPYSTMKKFKTKK